MLRGKRVWVAALGAAFGLAPRLASAHEVGLSRGDYSAEGQSIAVELAFARKELSGLVAGLDADRDGALSEAEINQGLGSIQGVVVNRVKVQGDGAPCSGKLMKVDLAEQDGVVLKASYRCPKRPTEAKITLALLDDLPFGHRHLARAFQAEGPLDLVLSQRVQSLSFKPPPAPVEAPRAEDSSMFVRGAKYAALTWTWPLCLMGLLAHRKRPIAVGAAFVAATLLGLSASALGVFAPSPRAAAVAMALSLVYVGIDALAAEGKAEPSTGLVALPFGAVHGLFAAAAVQGAPKGALVSFAMGALAAMMGFVAALVPFSKGAVAKHPSIRKGTSAAALVGGVAAIALAYRA